MKRYKVFWLTSFIVILVAMSSRTLAATDNIVVDSFPKIQLSIHSGCSSLSDGLEEAHIPLEITPRVKPINRFLQIERSEATVVSPRSSRQKSRHFRFLTIWFSAFDIASVFHSFW